MFYLKLYFNLILLRIIFKLPTIVSFNWNPDIFNVYLPPLFHPPPPILSPSFSPLLFSLSIFCLDVLLFYFSQYVTWKKDQSIHQMEKLAQSSVGSVLFSFFLSFFPFFFVFTIFLVFRIFGHLLIYVTSFLSNSC